MPLRFSRSSPVHECRKNTGDTLPIAAPKPSRTTSTFDKGSIAKSNVWFGPAAVAVRIEMRNPAGAASGTSDSDDWRSGGSGTQSGMAALYCPLAPQAMRPLPAGRVPLAQVYRHSMRWYMSRHVAPWSSQLPCTAKLSNATVLESAKTPDAPCSIIAVSSTLKT